MGFLGMRRLLSRPGQPPNEIHIGRLQGVIFLFADIKPSSDRATTRRLWQIQALAVHEG